VETILKSELIANFTAGWDFRLDSGLHYSEPIWEQN